MVRRSRASRHEEFHGGMMYTEFKDQSLPSQTAGDASLDNLKISSGQIYICNSPIKRGGP